MADSPDSQTILIPSSFRITVAVVFLIAMASSALGDWPQFRGPTAQGHAEGQPPIKWDVKLNVAWRKEIPGSGWSSPVVVGGKVYLTTAVPDAKENYSLRTIALDAKSGDTLWNVEVFQEDGAKSPKIHSKNSHASPTVFVDGENLFVHFGHLGTACLKADTGSIIWANQKLSYSPVHGAGGSPIVYGDKLIFSIDGSDKQIVVALDKMTGEVAWKTPREMNPKKAFSFATPLVISVDGKDQLISQGSDVVMALDPATGKEIWRVKCPGYSIVPRPVYGNGLLYLSTGYDSPVLYAIRPNGKGDVTTSHVAWTVRKDSMPRNASPLLIGDALYLVSDGGIISCLDAAKGTERWSENLSKPHTAAPVFVNGLIYLLAEDGTATVFRPGTSYDPVATNKLGERALASFAVDGNALFARTAKALYRIEGK